MLNQLSPEKLPDWTIFLLAGFLVATVASGVFLMTPAPAAEPSCVAQQEAIYLPDITVPEAPKSAIERPSEDWMWMAPDEASDAIEATGEPRRRRHGRRG